MSDMDNLVAPDDKPTKDEADSLKLEIQLNRVEDIVVKFSWPINSPIDCFMGRNSLDIIVREAHVLTLFYSERKLKVYHDSANECDVFARRILLGLPPAPEGQDQYVKLSTEYPEVSFPEGTHISIDPHSFRTTILIGVPQ